MLASDHRRRLVNDARMHQSQGSAHTANVHAGRRCDGKQDGIHLGPGARGHRRQAGGPR
ncbi:hypothetical protein F01_210121 [Burkholderia cenocepacia]|nr:hypothetical protein F01_210121 [Burkholderia cenocepacia]